MPIYELLCASCGPQTTVAKMSEAAAFMPCPQCERPRPQVFSVPYYTEDRLRFFKGAHGNGWSHALGAPMPDSRQARDKMALAKGVEFCSVTDLRRDSKEAADALDYKAHVDSGGERADPVVPDAASSWKSAPPPGLKV